jgi:hypothetical protein
MIGNALSTFSVVCEFLTGGQKNADQFADELLIAAM